MQNSIRISACLYGFQTADRVSLSALYPGYPQPRPRMTQLACADTVTLAGIRQSARQRTAPTAMCREGATADLVSPVGRMNSPRTLVEVPPGGSAFAIGRVRYRETPTISRHSRRIGSARKKLYCDPPSYCATRKDLLACRSVPHSRPLPTTLAVPPTGA